MDKKIVRVYLHSFVDIVVDADTREDAIDIAEGIAMNGLDDYIDQVNENLVICEDYDVADVADDDEVTLADLDALREKINKGADKVVDEYDEDFPRFAEADDF